MVHVLILEDDLNSLRALEKILTDYSDEIAVHTSSSYQEARKLLHNDIRYGLFLLYVNLICDNLINIYFLLIKKKKK